MSRKKPGPLCYIGIHFWTARAIRYYDPPGMPARRASLLTDIWESFIRLIGLSKGTHSCFLCGVKYGKR